MSLWRRAEPDPVDEVEVVPAPTIAGFDPSRHHIEGLDATFWNETIRDGDGNVLRSTERSEVRYHIESAHDPDDDHSDRNSVFGGLMTWW